jgi:hypothetical protein
MTFGFEVYSSRIYVMRHAQNKSITAKVGKFWLTLGLRDEGEV